MPKHVIFDLDGTLIDSAPSILASFSEALASLGIEPVVPLVPSLIGPPLMQTLSVISGVEDDNKLQQMAKAFKYHYDSEGFKQSVVYVGIPEMLMRLKTDGYALSIATNKRMVPTQKIITHLNWVSIFDSVYALDSCREGVRNKTGMIAQLLEEQKILHSDACYIGDRNEDGEAASYNALPFVMVEWGYGQDSLHELSNTTQPRWEVCAKPEQLPDYVVNL